MKKLMLAILCCLYTCCLLEAQQYTGMSGLIHTPSADMHREGEARIGIHFLHKEFLPASFTCGGKYHTTDHYLSITPLSWLELGYACTLMKGKKEDTSTDIGFYHKDRYLSFKIRLLKEKSWYPSIAVGSNDPGTYDKEKAEDTPDQQRNQLFGNFYVAASKHIELKGNNIGVHLSVRSYKWSYNRQWNGIVGGISLRPAFHPSLRFMAEYTGSDCNIGADCLLWKHWLVQASLQNGKYFCGGICYQLNLLGKR